MIVAISVTSCDTKTEEPAAVTDPATTEAKVSEGDSIKKTSETEVAPETKPVTEEKGQ